MPKGKVPPPPAMTIIVDVDGGPTVRLAYDGRWVGVPLVAGTRITIVSPISEQHTPFGPDDLRDLLVQASAVLLGYGSADDDWPADLRPAPQSPQALEACTQQELSRDPGWERPSPDPPTAP